MNMRTLIGVVGAMALAFGSAAHAVKIDGEYSVTYAKETLLKAATATHTVSGVTYYVLEPQHAISGMADITAATGDTTDYEVIFTLENMVFSAAVTATSLVTTAVPDAQGNARTGASYTLVRGGAVEDNFVVFAKTGAETIAAADTLTLTAEFAITEDGPGGITRMITNEALPTTLPGIKVSMTHVNPDAVKVERALKEMVVAADPMPRADAADDFMSFFGGTAQNPHHYASLGTVMVGVKPGIRDARVAADDASTTEVNEETVTLTGLREADGTLSSTASGNAGIIALGVLDDPTDTAGSVVTFSGEFSFLKTLALSADCSGTLTELRKSSKDDRTVLTDETMPRAAGVFATAMHLCVAVDGETVIPLTGPYTVTTEYKGPAENKFPPVGATYNLAGIGRTGAVFRIPLLTVNERHNQRISIVNRGDATTYTLSELSTIGDSVSALDMATGDLPPGQTVLLVSDLIEIMGAQRASGTLHMPADPRTIDVSIDIVNRENGSIDTVYVR